MSHRLTLVPLAGTFAICRLDPSSPAPAWATGEFVSVTRTAEELSVVCADDGVPSDVRCERGWRAWRLAGTFDLNTAVGVLAAVTGPLAEAGIGLFAISTYDTDYLLVKADNATRGAEALRRHGHTVGE
jgi:hypothetical protein